MDDRIFAVGLLTRSQVERLGPTFTRLWPVDDAPCFDGLLQAIDEADRAIGSNRHAADRPAIPLRE